MLPLEAAVNAAFAPCRKLSARTQAHAVLPGAVGAEFICGKFLFVPFGAGPHASLPRVLHFLFLPGEPRQCAAPACDAMVTSFHFPGRPGKERSQRKGAAGQAKNKRAAHTVRPAPTPGPLILTLTFPIHFDDHIKRITRLRTSPIHSPASAPSGHNGKHPRMAPKGPTRPHRLRSTINKICESASPAIERKACRDGPKGGRHDFPQMHIYPFLPSGFAVCERKRGLLACVRTA